MMDNEPTIIIKSLRDLNRLLYGTADANMQASNSTSNFSNVSRLKLSFSDSVCSVDSINNSSISLKLAESISINNGESVLEPTSTEKHQNEVAGFDICRKLRDKNKEIIQGKAAISLLESKAGNFQMLNKKMSVQYENEIETFRKNNIEDKEQINELKYQLKNYESTQSNLKEEIASTKQYSNEKIFNAEKKSLSSQESNMKLVNNLLDEKNDLQKQVGTLQNALEEANFKISMSEDQNKQLEDQLKDMSSTVSSSELLKHEIENYKLKLSKSELQNKELLIRQDELKDTESKQQLLDKSLIKLSTLEKETKKLKDENYNYRISALNMALIEEKLSSAEKEVDVLNNRCKNLAEENATLITLRNLSEQCELVIREQLKLDFSPSPAELKDIMADLCSCDSEIKNSVNELKASVKSHESFRENQEAQLAKFRAELEVKQDKMNRDIQLVRRLHRKLLMISKERDSLKDIITSYESESTLNITALEKQKIAALDSQLSMYKQELARLETEVGATNSSDNNSIVKDKDSKLTDKIVSLEKKVVEFEELVEILNEEKEALEHRIETQLPKGTYNPMTTKVVQFVNNPLAESHNEKKNLVEQLQKENESLKCRLKLIDEGEQLNITQKVGANVENINMIKDLKEQIEAGELRTKRLMEVFKKKAYNLREVMYRLIGYRIDVGTDNRYKLINMYSESQNDFLLFEESPNGDLEMLQTDFSCNLEDLMEEYLEQMSSYPAFLSAVTLHLLGKPSAQEHASDEEEPVSDLWMGNTDDRQSDVDDQQSDDIPSECSDPPSDVDEEQSDCDEQPSDGECDDDDNEDDGRPSKRMKIDTDDDDDLICLD